MQHQQLTGQPYLPVAEHVAWQQQLQQQYAAVLVQQQQVCSAVTCSALSPPFATETTDTRQFWCWQFVLMGQEKLHAALCPQERLQPPHGFHGPQEQESRQQPKMKENTKKKKKKSFKNAASAAALTQQREAFSTPTSACATVPEALFRSLTFDSSFV